MRYALVSAALAATASAHGLVTRIQGANGVMMPGLSGKFFSPTLIHLHASKAPQTNMMLIVADGTPRDCSSNGCGSQADTAIIRDRDMGSGKASPLGRTQGNGPIDAGAVISNFMGGNNAGKAPTNKGASGSVGQEDDLSGLKQRRAEYRRQLGQLFGGLLGGAGGAAGGAAGGKAAGGAAGGLGGLLGGLGGAAGGGGKKNNAAPESMVADTAGMGSAQGLPTADQNGEVSLVFRQVRCAL